MYLMIQVIFLKDYNNKRLSRIRSLEIIYLTVSVIFFYDSYLISFVLMHFYAIPCTILTLQTGLNVIESIYYVFAHLLLRIFGKTTPVVIIGHRLTHVSHHLWVYQFAILVP